VRLCFNNSSADTVEVVWRWSNLAV
jgi:hypothetical protein